MVSEHLQELKTWVSENSGKTFSSYLSETDLQIAYKLRSILGEMMKSALLSFCVSIDDTDKLMTGIDVTP